MTSSMMLLSCQIKKHEKRKLNENLDKEDLLKGG